MCSSTTGCSPRRAHRERTRRVGPIVVNDNVIDILVDPAPKAGEPATVKLGAGDDVRDDGGQVETVAAGRPRNWRSARSGPRRFAVRGRVPVGHARVVRIYEVEDPASFARTLLIEALRRRGVRVEASPLGENTTARLPAARRGRQAPKVAEYTSPPFREYIRVILKVSHNLHASTLPLLLAAHHGETTLEAGLSREGESSRSWGSTPGDLLRRRGRRGRGPTWRRRGRPWPCSGRWPPGPSSPPTRRPCRSSAATARWPRPSPPTAPRGVTPGPRPAPTGSRTGSTARAS